MINPEIESITIKKSNSFEESLKNKRPKAMNLIKNSRVNMPKKA